MLTRIVIGLAAVVALVFAVQNTENTAVAKQAIRPVDQQIEQAFGNGTSRATSTSGAGAAATAGSGVVGNPVSFSPSGSFIWPLSGSAQPDTLNSPFGPRLKASANYAYEFHPGIDLAAPQGTPVHATADGTVRLLTDFTGRRITSANAIAPASGTLLYPNGGMIVQLDHGSLIYTNSMHLSRQAVGLVSGSAVKRGDIIGFVGHSGTTTFDHLHFEVRVGSYYERDATNPLGYLPLLIDSKPRIIKVARQGTDVIVSVETGREDLNFNEIVVTSLDQNGKRLDEVVVNFNGRINCGTNSALSGRVSLKPAQFNRYSPVYSIDATFSGVSTASGGRIEVRARDVGGTNEAISTLPT